MRTAIIGSILMLGACTAANGEGGGRDGETRGPGQRSFDVGAFQSVALEGAHDVVVSVGGAPSVRAEGDPHALEQLDIRVENGALRIGSRRRQGWLGRDHGRVTVHVTAPALTGASIGGAGDLRIDRIQSDRFAASIAGAGDIEIGTLQASRVDFSIAGSGEIRAAGTADQTGIDIAGSGNVRLEGLQTRRASVSIAGSGDARLRVTETVDGSILGSGNVTVSGPARCSVSRLGSGDLRCET